MMPTTPIFIFFLTIAVVIHGITIQMPGFDPITDPVTVGDYEGKSYVWFGSRLKLHMMPAHKHCLKYGMQLVDIPTIATFDWIVTELLPGHLLNETHTDAHHIAWTSINDMYNEGSLTNLYSGRPHLEADLFHADKIKESLDKTGKYCIEIIYYGTPKTYHLLRFGCNSARMSVICTFEQGTQIGGNKACPVCN